MQYLLFLLIIINSSSYSFFTKHSSKHRHRHRHSLKHRHKQASIYKSFCAEQTRPYVLVIKCDQECHESEVAFIEFANYGKQKGECPSYIATYCGIDIVNKLNQVCKEKKKCKMAITDQLGIPDGCEDRDAKVIFACTCQLQAPESATRIKTLQSDGQQVFLEQQERLYSESEGYYAMIDKEANFQVFNEDGDSKWETGSLSKKGNPPFFLEVGHEGDLAVKDNSDKIVWHTDTGGVGKQPFKLSLSDKGKLYFKDAMGEDLWKSK